MMNSHYFRRLGHHCYEDMTSNYEIKDFKNYRFETNRFNIIYDERLDKFICFEKTTGTIIFKYSQYLNDEFDTIELIEINSNIDPKKPDYTESLEGLIRCPASEKFVEVKSF